MFTSYLPVVSLSCVPLAGSSSIWTSTGSKGSSSAAAVGKSSIPGSASPSPSPSPKPSARKSTPSPPKPSSLIGSSRARAERFTIVITFVYI